MKKINKYLISINSILVGSLPAISLVSCSPNNDPEDPEIKEYSFSIEQQEYIVENNSLDFEIHCSEQINDTLSNIVLSHSEDTLDSIESCAMVDDVATIHFTNIILPVKPFSVNDALLSFHIDGIDKQSTISDISISASEEPIDVEFKLIEHSYFDSLVSEDAPAMYSSEPLYLQAGEEYTFVFTSLLDSDSGYETTPTLLIYTDDGHDFAITNDFYSEPLLSIEGDSTQYKGSFTVGNVYTFWKAYREGWSVNNDLYNKKITITLKLKRNFNAARIEFLYKNKPGASK